MSIMESLLAAMIMAIVAATAMLPFAAGMQNIQEANKLERAVALGQGLMEEILARPYDVVASSVVTSPPSAGDKDRSHYTTVKQFDGYSESDKVARDYKGNVIASSSVGGYWRVATVSAVTYSQQDPVDTGNLARVQVLVYYNNTLLVDLDRLVGREY